MTKLQWIVILVLMVVPAVVTGYFLVIQVYSTAPQYPPVKTPEGIPESADKQVPQCIIEEYTMEGGGGGKLGDCPEPTITSPNNDIADLQTKMIGYFEGHFYYNGRLWMRGLPTRDPSLSAFAFGNAQNGTHSFKIVANSSEIAYETFLNYESNHYTHWGSTFFLAVADTETTYDIGIYETNNTYNICVVFNTKPPTTTVLTPEGAYKLVQPNDVVSYLW